jgi:hypothetical protein
MLMDAESYMQFLVENRDMEHWVSYPKLLLVTVYLRPEGGFDIVSALGVRLTQRKMLESQGVYLIDPEGMRQRLDDFARDHIQQLMERVWKSNQEAMEALKPRLEPISRRPQ